MAIGAIGGGDMALPIYDYSKESGLGVIVAGVPYDVNAEINSVLRDIQSGALNKGDLATAQDYLQELKKQAPNNAAIQNYYDRLGGKVSDDAAPGSGSNAPFIGFPKVLGPTDKKAADEAIAKREEMEKENSFWGKVQDIVGNVGLVVLGVGVTVAAIYFTAKKV